MAGQFLVRLRSFGAGGRVTAVVGASALMLAGVAPVALAAQVSGATISGGAGTVTVGGALYAKQNGAISINVTTDSDTQCVDAKDSTGARSRSSVESASRSASAAEACPTSFWL